jgi:hypothetical protein
MDPRRKLVAILLNTLLICATALAAGAQGNRGIPPLETPRAGQTFSQGMPGAQTYFDLPEQKLRAVVSELKGIRFEAGQDRLPSILAGVGKTIADLLPRLPNLVSREEVFRAQDAHNAQPWNREFKYLILCHHNRDGTTDIEESRTDSKGRPVDLSGPSMTAQGYGFAYQWLLFSAANQREFHFRYLGQQEKNGRDTFVVAFAQDPARVSAPANFQLGKNSAPFFYQGVLWIDQTTSVLVLMRTDLLAPVPSLQLRQFTTKVEFGLVPIHGYDATFWLPHKIDMAFDQGDGPIEEDHQYSDYHLFHSETRILPEP